MPVVRIAAIGLGNRTTKYLRFVSAHPEKVALTAAVDVAEDRLDAVRNCFHLPDDRCWLDADSFFSTRRDDVDAVIIGSPDCTHHDYALKAVGYGYHVLLEKPVGVTPLECRDIARRASEAGVILATCYVLRYNPYFEELKELCSDPSLGRIVSVEHTVNVGIDRTTHSYVRGPWNTREMESTMFLSKCCHDVDLALWLLRGKAVSVLSHGSRKLFVPGNAPEGSADRCLECKVEKGCPYSAVDLYLRRRDWIDSFIPAEGETKDDAIMRELRDGRYGRCAFRCYNDAISHQTVFFETDCGETATINMESLTGEDNRVTVIRFVGGVVSGDERKITVHYFSGGPDRVYDFSGQYHQPLHGNADLKLVEAFVGCIASGDRGGIRTEIDESLMSHLVCFAAEESRIEGKTIKL